MHTRTSGIACSVVAFVEDHATCEPATAFRVLCARAMSQTRTGNHTASNNSSVAVSSTRPLLLCAWVAVCRFEGRKRLVCFVTGKVGPAAAALVERDARRKEGGFPSVQALPRAARRLFFFGSVGIKFASKRVWCYAFRVGGLSLSATGAIRCRVPSA